MRIEEIASIIESSMRKIAEDDCCECNECCDDDNKTRELIVEAVGHFIDGELHEIERLIFEIGEERFGSEEELEAEEEKPDLSLYYQKIDEIDRPLRAVRKLAEVKRYLEARNAGFNKEIE